MYEEEHERELAAVVATMVFDNWTPDQIAAEARRLAVAIAGEIDSQIAPVPPLPASGKQE